MIADFFFLQNIFILLFLCTRTELHAREVELLDIYDKVKQLNNELGAKNVNQCVKCGDENSKIFIFFTHFFSLPNQSVACH